MEPMIKPGDVILVDKATSIEEIYSLKEGDVIQFSRDAILISHRIVEIGEEEGVKVFLTKGDNNSSLILIRFDRNRSRVKLSRLYPKLAGLLFNKE